MFPAEIAFLAKVFVLYTRVAWSTFIWKIAAPHAVEDTTRGLCCLFVHLPQSTALQVITAVSRLCAAECDYANITT